jgi:hypothetical protein
MWSMAANYMTVLTTQWADILDDGFSADTSIACWLAGWIDWFDGWCKSSSLDSVGSEEILFGT